MRETEEEITPERQLSTIAQILASGLLRLEACAGEMTPVSKEPQNAPKKPEFGRK